MGRNETADKVCCGSAMKGELEQVNGGGIIIKVCILILSPYKIFYQGTIPMY